MPDMSCRVTDSHLDGCISWRHPEDAVKQRERLKQERNAQHEQMSEPASEFEEQVEVVPTQEAQAENEQEFE